MADWDRRFLNLAEYISAWSKDPSTKVGAVISRPDNTIASLGYNGFPRYVNDGELRYANKALKYKMVVHAEVNAILKAKEPLDGYTLYVHPLHPCSSCAAIIIQSGISKVVTNVSDRPDWAESFAIAKAMFCEAHVDVKVFGDA